MSYSLPAVILIKMNYKLTDYHNRDEEGSIEFLATEKVKPGISSNPALSVRVVLEQCSVSDVVCYEGPGSKENWQSNELSSLSEFQTHRGVGARGGIEAGSFSTR
ncbi:hypothetical protein R1flu_000594 [Riccia fluitans]|uniref:Uncharacterized protein n=1 Tax=Riccia fluitans TaxID=41844 RepID=A0ABD1Y507_9MARC